KSEDQCEERERSDVLRFGKKWEGNEIFCSQNTASQNLMSLTPIFHSKTTPIGFCFSAIE
ncbi:hypothetical protein KK467_29545, partial [Klebsiella pneumoniae]|uniref:hypothetical protein n=1 Tax=Klebsiella pneumoniae TaxID=573 RepID=UPI001BDFEC6D